MPHVNKKNSLTYRFFFHTSISRSLQNSDRNKESSDRNKKSLFSLNSSFRSATKSLQISSRVSFPASKFTPIKLIKKGLLQYSSSSRKKQYNSISLNSKKKTKRRPIIALAIAVRLIKERQRPNTIQNL